MSNISIIGTGFVADLYMRSLETFPDIKLLKVYDKNPERLSAFCVFWKVEAASDIDDLLAIIDGIKPDLILNLTNPNSHYELSKH